MFEMEASESEEEEKAGAVKYGWQKQQLKNKKNKEGGEEEEDNEGLDGVVADLLAADGEEVSYCSLITCHSLC